MEKSTKNTFGNIPYAIAIGVIIAYGFFIYFLVGKVDAEELNWSRLTYLFSGVEAIVFAAAGFLFGREVNRKRADNAEYEKKRIQEEKKQVEKQKEEMKENAVKERNNALILGAMAIQAEKNPSGVQRHQVALEGITAEPQPVSSMAKSARSMYPELENL